MARVEWPDGQPMTLHPSRRQIWVAADGQQGELALCIPSLDMPPESIIFPTPPDDPYGGTSLDDEDTLNALDEAVRIHKPAFVVVDSLTYATQSDISEQRAIAKLKDPLVTLAQTHQVIVMLLLHVSRGRPSPRATHPRDHAHADAPGMSRSGVRPDRLRLWVEKSYAAKPPALGSDDRRVGQHLRLQPAGPDGHIKGRTAARKAGKGHASSSDDAGRTERPDRERAVPSLGEDHGGSDKTFWRAVKDMTEAGELETEGGERNPQANGLAPERPKPKSLGYWGSVRWPWHGTNPTTGFGVLSTRDKTQNPGYLRFCPKGHGLRDAFDGIVPVNTWQMTARGDRLDWSAIRDRIDLAAVATSLLGPAPGRRGGKGRLWWKCPFHDDKNPSFHVNPIKGTWKCYGCSEHGDAAALVMKLRH